MVVAGAVHAATVTWASGLLKTPANKEGGYSTTTIASGDVSSYLFLLTADAFNTYSADASAIYSDWKAGTITASKSANTGTSSALKTDNVYGANDTVYAAILYVNGNTTAYEGVEEFYMAGTSTWTFPGTSSKSFANFASGLGGWTAVATPEPPEPPIDSPEPTSGLLMLIGAAGLALRRKRA